MMTTEQKANAIYEKSKYLLDRNHNVWSVQCIFGASIEVLENIKTMSEETINTIYESWCNAPGG